MNEIREMIFSENIYELATNMFVFTFILDFVLSMFNIIKGGYKSGRS